jgi:hypothetical protein
MADSSARGARQRTPTRCSCSLSFVATHVVYDRSPHPGSRLVREHVSPEDSKRPQGVHQTPNHSSDHRVVMVSHSKNVSTGDPSETRTSAQDRLSRFRVAATGPELSAELLAAWYEYRALLEAESRCSFWCNPAAPARSQSRGAGRLLSCCRRSRRDACIATIAITWTASTASLLVVRWDHVAGRDPRRAAALGARPLVAVNVPSLRRSGRRVRPRGPGLRACGGGWANERPQPAAAVPLRDPNAAGVRRNHGCSQLLNLASVERPD